MNWPRTVVCKFGLALAVVCMAAAAGCAAQTERVYFRPVGTVGATGPDWVAQGKYRLPPGSGLAEVEISARGTIENSKDKGRQEYVALKYQVQNRGVAPLSLDPMKVHLLDDDGNQIGAAATTTTDSSAAVIVAGGTKLAFELRFALPDQVRLANIGSIRAVWPYAYGDKPYEEATKFIKIEEVDYYAPGYYYGGGYYGPYYDPWYGPYGPYGPAGPWSHRYYWEGDRDGYRRR